MTRRATLDERFAKRLADDRVTRKCGSKRRIGSRKEAIAASKRVVADHPVFFYKCSVCHGFHLTSRPPAP